MSMFHELMMRRFHSAKNYINLALVGNLANNNGIVSGFSSGATTYIDTDNFILDTSQDFEIVIKANTGNLSATNFKAVFRNSYGSSAGSTGFAIGIPTNVGNKLQSYILDTNGNYISNGETGVTTFSNNQDFLLKFSQIGNNVVLSTSLDNGTTWTTENSWTTTAKIRNSGQGVAFGGGSINNAAQYWSGSFDFNSSYIKLNGVKYIFTIGA